MTGGNDPLDGHTQSFRHSANHPHAALVKNHVTSSYTTIAFKSELFYFDPGLQHDTGSRK
jgi:hypothetical protein